MSAKETSAAVAHLAAQLAPLTGVELAEKLLHGGRLSTLDGRTIGIDEAIRKVAASALTQREEEKG